MSTCEIRKEILYAIQATIQYYTAHCVAQSTIFFKFQRINDILMSREYFFSFFFFKNKLPTLRSSIHPIAFSF